MQWMYWFAKLLGLSSLINEATRASSDAAADRCVEKYREDNAWFESLPEDRRRARELKCLKESLDRARLSEAQVNARYNELRRKELRRKEEAR